jgi:Fe-S-cluster containining protein
LPAANKNARLRNPNQIGQNISNNFMQDILLKNWEKKSAEHQKQYKDFLNKANKNAVLKELPRLHEEAFEKIDCLTCANCCKNYSPRFKTPDIKRIAKHLKMKEGDFIETYLKVDEDGDYVARSLPCPFLGDDNYCSIYEQRPSDCHRFPYTDEDVIIKRKSLTQKNSTFCPIVYYVLENLIKTTAK